MFRLENEIFVTLDIVMTTDIVVVIMVFYVTFPGFFVLGITHFLSRGLNFNFTLWYIKIFVEISERNAKSSCLNSCVQGVLSYYY